MNFKTRIDLLQRSQKDNVEQVTKLQKENNRINNIVELLYPKEVTRALKLDDKIARWEETFNTSEEYIKSEREFRRMLVKLYNKQIDEEYRKYVRSKHPKIEDFMSISE